MKTLAEWHPNDMPGIGDLAVWEDVDDLGPNIVIEAADDGRGWDVWCRVCHADLTGHPEDFAAEHRHDDFAAEHHHTKDTTR